MNSTVQARAHSGHSHGHHHHDNTYLTSKNKNDAGVRVTRLGLYVNFGMAVTKGIGGYYLNSQALVADGIHSFTDLLSDFMTLATISVALKPPTTKYPNGFGKVESFGSLMVSGMLLAGGVFMCQHAGGALYHQFFADAAQVVDHGHGIMGHSHSHSAADMIPNINAAWLAAGSIILKEYLYRITMKVAKERKSSVLASNAVHHRVDSLTSIVALLAIGGSHIFNGAAWLDPVGGFIVALMVIHAGLMNTIAAIYELCDTGIDDEVKGSIRKAATKIFSSKEQTVVETRPFFSEGSVRDIQGIKAGQNYLVDVEVAAPATWTLAQMRDVEDAVRLQVGSKVRGVRRVRVKFVTKDHESQDFQDEFIAADVNQRESPEPEANGHAHDHDHGHKANGTTGNGNLKKRL